MEEQTTRDGFWDDHQEAHQVNKQIRHLQEEVDRYQQLLEEACYLREMLEMADNEQDSELLQEVSRELEDLQQRFREYQLLILFSGEHDKSDGIVSLHAGAGGTEAQDWVEMLLRMYTRWAEAAGYQVQVLYLLPGDEAGVKSVTLLVKGDYAYGKLKCEQGVHRLIRVSPFDSTGRRHTSFASLNVLPEISAEVQIKINPEELRIDTYRSSGAGGQHVNKTDSAVRITHIPTGIVVQCQNERSQHANRLAAMKILTVRLYELKQKEIEANLENLKGEYKEIAWGSQIRTYTLNPFSLIKDHRTGWEEGNVQAVLDGKLDDFIYACLAKKAEK